MEHTGPFYSEAAKNICLRKIFNEILVVSVVQDLPISLYYVILVPDHLAIPASRMKESLRNLHSSTQPLSFIPYQISC